MVAPGDTATIHIETSNADPGIYYLSLQAKKAAEAIKSKLLQPGGVTTTEKNTNQQWDSPNGWAPLQWIAIQGLAKYGFDKLAKDIAQRWLNINEKVYHNTGKMMEKYNVVDTNLPGGGGEYASQDGFGWTNGVLLTLINKYQLHPND